MNSKIKLLPHNQKLYDEIKKHIDAGERSIFYSEATGLGKSYIFMRLVEEYFSGKSILYIVPKIAIWDNLTHYAEFSKLSANIEMSTFTAFNRYNSDDRLYEKYDVVFVDECHHMLSDIQGMNVAIFLEDMCNNNKHTFGFTATPKYEDVYVDEIYFKASCYGYDVFEAIKNDLFPKIDIAVADIDFEEIPKDLCKKFSVLGTKSVLEQIIDERSDITHWLAYFSSITDLEENVQQINKLFPDFEIIKLYQNSGDPRDIINYFENYNGKIILMSVSMLLEGMHLRNVGGVLLYRNVIKSSTYFQIYGRLCKLGSGTSPLLVDITNSIMQITDFSAFKSSRFVGSRSVYSRRDLFDVTSRTYRYIELKDELNPFKEKEYRGICWTTGRSLSRALGKSPSAYGAWLVGNPDKNMYDYIDCMLGDTTYEEYINNGYKQLSSITICGEIYKYSTYEDLLRQTGRTGNYDRNIDKLKEMIEWEYSVGCVHNRSYRGINISTMITISKAMQMNSYALIMFIKREKVTVTECIDMYLDEDKWYRGIMLVNGISTLSEMTGTSTSQICKVRRRLGSLKETIDYFLPTSKEYRGIKITYPIDNASLANQLGVSKVAMLDYFRKHSDKSLEECIDFYLDKRRAREIDSILKEKFNTCSKEELSKLVPDKDYNYCFVRASELGLVHITGNQYSLELLDDEVELMNSYKGTDTRYFDIAIALNNLECNIARGVMRTVKTIYSFYHRSK